MADALNLDSRAYRDGDNDGRKVGRKLFCDALAEARRRHRRHRWVRELSVLADSYFQSDYLRGIMDASPGMDMDALLAAPALRRLEKLRLELRAEFCQIGDEYVLPASRVPGQGLRVLDLYGCTLGPPGGAAAFRRLETLKLVFCRTSLDDLQAMLDAAPRLERLCLEAITFTAEEHGRHWYDVMSTRRLLLRCPDTTTSVTVIHCHRTAGLDVDAPSARELRFTGFLEHFPFGSAAAAAAEPVDLEHVELSFCRARGTRRCVNHPPREAPPHALFWESVGRFRRLRVLKLELLDINDIAAVEAGSGEEEGVFLNVLFPDIVLLELEGSHEVDSHGAAAAIANLLRCCPGLQEFHLKFKGHGDGDNLNAFGKPWTHFSDERNAQLGLEKSMESLMRLKSGRIIAPPSSSGVGDDADMAPFMACSFPCLESHLRKVRLEFELKCLDCFEVRLAKFLVENALVLEEMEVHDGFQRVCDHIHTFQCGEPIPRKPKLRLLESIEMVPACKCGLTSRNV